MRLTGFQPIALEFGLFSRHKELVLTSELPTHIAGDLTPLISRIRRAFGVRSFQSMEECHA
jgi:hypothetical protein